MAITAADWSRRVEITDANTSPTLSGYVALLTGANLPAEIWSTAINGGGDLRVCLNSDGTSQLPLEVVSFDTVAETGVLWVRFPTFTSGDSIWLFYGKAGETQPLVGAAFGRNAVWSDYEAVLHLDDTSWTDSTGNSYTGVGTGGVGVTTGNPFGGNWADLDGIDDVITIPTGANLNNSFLTVQVITQSDLSNANDVGVISNRFSTQGNNFFQISDRNTGLISVLHDGNGENGTRGSALTVGATAWVAMTTSASSIIQYINGTQNTIDTSIAGDNQFVTSLNTRIGTYFDGSAFRSYNGKFADARIRKSALSANLLATEYANQSSPATFWSTGAPENTGGGGLTIITSPIPSAESVGNPVLPAGTVVISPEAIASAEALGNPTLSQQSQIAPLSINTEEFVGNPIVTPQGVIITPVEIPTGSSVGNPEVSVGLVLVFPEEILSGEVVGQPLVDTLLKQIFPTEIASLLSVGRPLVLGGDSIVIPIASRQTWNAVAKYLRELVFTGADNDVIMKWLRSEGYEDAYNDNWQNYLLSEGFLDGALADRYAKWKSGAEGSDPWLLFDGTWNDNRIWRDTEIWKDN